MVSYKCKAYHSCLLHSTAFILCIAMFITKAFSLDCPYNTYIMISMIISVISTAVNISTSARKLFRNV